MVSTVPLETVQKSQKRHFACFAITLLLVIGFAFSNKSYYLVNQDASDSHIIGRLLSEMEALKASEKAHQAQISQLTTKLTESEKQFEQLSQEIRKLKEVDSFQNTGRILSVQREDLSDNKAYDDELYENQHMYENIESRLNSYVTIESLASVVEYYEEKFEEINRELDEQKKNTRESREDLEILSSYDEEEDKKGRKEPLEKVKTFVRATEKKLDKIKDLMVNQAGEVKEASKKLGKEAEKEAHKLLKKAQDLKDSISNIFHK